MNQSSIPDLSPITQHLRAMYRSRLLLAAVHHLNVFEILRESALTIPELQARLQWKERPAMVLFPSLCAMQMLQRDAAGRLSITETGRYLTQRQSPNLLGYTGLEKDDPGVLEMVELLKNDGPIDAPEGVSYVKDGEAPSPMDDPEAARYFTLALAGRAQLLSPLVANHLSQSKGHLLDVAGGTGMYAYEWLLLNPDATATVFDRPEVLKVAAEFLTKLEQSGRPGAENLRNRVRFQPGDMLVDPLPETDLLLAASLFHDWPIDTCEKLAHRFAQAIRPGGELWAHDAFLNDTLDGPLPVTDYSAALFAGTKGRAYSRREYRQWFSQAGLQPTDEDFPTGLDYSLIRATKLNRS
jgi:hypothetical protein